MALALLEQGAERPGLIVPVPLHPKRLRERGYNQALEVAREVSAALAIPIDCTSCVRSLHTGAQVGLDDRERRRNVRGAFAVLRPPAARQVAILDDVVTTGSTVDGADPRTPCGRGGAGGRLGGGTDALIWGWLDGEARDLRYRSGRGSPWPPHAAAMAPADGSVSGDRPGR